MKRYLQAVKKYKNAYATMTECYREAQKFALSFAEEQVERLVAMCPKGRETRVCDDEDSDDPQAVRIYILHEGVQPSFHYVELIEGTNEWLFFKDYKQHWKYRENHDVRHADAITKNGECSYVTFTPEDCGMDDIFFPDFSDFAEILQKRGELSEDAPSVFPADVKDDSYCPATIFRDKSDIFRFIIDEVASGIRCGV